MLTYMYNAISFKPLFSVEEPSRSINYNYSFDWKEKHYYALNFVGSIKRKNKYGDELYEE